MIRRAAPWLAWSALLLAIMCCGAEVTMKSRFTWIDGLPDDNDSLTRVAFLEWAISHGSLARHLFARDGAPIGASLHWTMPFDIIVTSVATPFALFEGWHTGFRHALLALVPIELAATCAAVASLARSLNLGRAVPWAVVVIAFSPAAYSYAASAPGGHHQTTVAMAVTMFAVVMNMVRFPGRGRGPIVAAMLVLCVWQSIETLPQVAVGAAILLVATTKRASARATFDRLAAMLAIMALLPVFIDPDAAGRFSISIDRYSMIHVLGFWTISVWLVLMPRLVEQWSGTARLMALTALAAPAPLVVLLAVHRIPAAFTDPICRFYFINGNMDLASTLDSSSGRLVMIPAMIATIILAVGTLRRARTRQGPYWLLAFLILAAETALGWSKWRLSPYAATLAAIPIGSTLATVAGCVPFLRTINRQAGIALLCAFVVAIFLWSHVGPTVADLERKRPATGCLIGDERATRISESLSDGAVVMADVWITPELLARTSGLRTVAGPYHRNVTGIDDVAAVLLNDDDVFIRRILAKREVAAILVCTDPDYVGRTAFPIKSLEGRLARNDIPSWLVPLDIGTGTIRLYRVVPASL